MDPPALVGRPRSSAASDSIVTVSSDASDWPDYLRRASGASLFHDPRWGLVMARAYGNRPFYLTARRDGAPVGLLQLIGQKSLLFGSHLCSLPYFDAAGILAGDEPARDALLSRAEQLMNELGADWVEIRQATPIARSLPTRKDKVALVLDLPGRSEQLWKLLKAKVRNQIRKAQREGLTASRGDERLLGEFYPVYARNMRDLGSPPHAKRFFRLICGQFRRLVRVFVVRSGGRAVAASLTVRDGGTVHVPWAASDWRLRQVCPNMLLYWSMLADACDTGAASFDFDRSTLNSGTYRFKKQWGARDLPLYWHYLTRLPGRVPALRPDSPKYRFLAACWRRLPVRLASLLGPRVISKLH